MMRSIAKISAKITFLFVIVGLVQGSSQSWATDTGSISGVVQDSKGPIEGASVKVFRQNQLGKEQPIQTVIALPSEKFHVDLKVGDYEVLIEKPGFASYSYSVHVTSGGDSHGEFQLDPQLGSKEMVVEVKAKRRLIHTSASTSSTEINQEEIRKLPQGSEISLPKLLASTNPGVVQGAFGQLFFRGNHANIQYQIDGVQLPESPSNTFGQAFSPRNIDHMEVITGGIPAEYGMRLGAVVNILTKSGPEKPEGELELNYGSYNTTTPHLLYGGTNESGSLRYFLSLNYNRTDRGLDTPQPESVDNQFQGGKESIHNTATGNGEFARVDWQADNSNKFVFSTFHSYTGYQIPNYPSSFSPSMPYFSSTYVDPFGNEPENHNGHTHGIYNYTPSDTDDRHSERNFYAQAAWKHTFSERSFLQLAPYYKFSQVIVEPDPANDLFTSATGANPIAGASPTSFAQNRRVNNLGLKGDYSLRPNDSHLIKTGFQVQASRSDGFFSIQRDLNTPAFSNSDPYLGYFESAYVQDDIKLAKPLILNVGLRFDATQFEFSNVYTSDYLFQPRVGLNYMVSDSTKIHAYYGKLFQPAPLENLRTTFNHFEPDPTPYDIKAEKADYFELGVAHQLLEKQVVSLTGYYKDGVNILDDAQLLRTPIAQPFNFATGFAYGAELSVKGKLTEDWSDFLNYSYQIAKGKGISGGIWTGDAPTGTDYQTMDHVQEHKANAGLTYNKNHFWWTLLGLYGSGLRTGENNSRALPAHFTMDTTVGYEFHGDSWFSNFRISSDVVNIFDNVYPVTIANGFNTSHYAAGRQYFIRIAKLF